MSSDNFIQRKKYLFNLFGLLIVLCLYNACSKKENVTIKGKVIDHEKPIPGVQVQLQYWKVGNGSNPTYYKNVNADANGEFAIPVNFKAGYLYQLNVTLADHYGVEGQRVYKDLYSVVQLYPYAYVKLRIIKTGNQNNKMQVYSTGFNFNSAATAPYDTTLSTVTRIKASLKSTISWSVTNQSMPVGPQNPNQLSGSFQVAPAETYVYTIRYE